MICHSLIQLRSRQTVCALQNCAAELLIHREPSNLTSPAGWSFVEYARRILDRVAEARAAVTGEEPQGSFALGSLKSTAAVRIPELLPAYNRQCAKVELDLSTGPSGTMIDAVLAGRLAAAFVDGPVLHPALEGVAALRAGRSAGSGLIVGHCRRSGVSLMLFGREPTIQTAFDLTRQVQGTRHHAAVGVLNQL